jgi:hypothetical protein
LHHLPFAARAHAQMIVMWFRRHLGDSHIMWKCLDHINYVGRIKKLMKPLMPFIGKRQQLARAALAEALTTRMRMLLAHPFKKPQDELCTNIESHARTCAQIVVHTANQLRKLKSIDDDFKATFARRMCCAIAWLAGYRCSERSMFAMVETRLIDYKDFEYEGHVVTITRGFPWREPLVGMLQTCIDCSFTAARETLELAVANFQRRGTPDWVSSSLVPVCQLRNADHLHFSLAQKAIRHACNRISLFDLGIPFEYAIIDESYEADVAYLFNLNDLLQAFVQQAPFETVMTDLYGHPGDRSYIEKLEPDQECIMYVHEILRVWEAKGYYVHVNCDFADAKLHVSYSDTLRSRREQIIKDLTSSGQIKMYYDQRRNWTRKFVNEFRL